MGLSQTLRIKGAGEQFMNNVSGYLASLVLYTRTLYRFGTGSFHKEHQSQYPKDIQAKNQQTNSYYIITISAKSGKSYKRTEKQQFNDSHKIDTRPTVYNVVLC